MPRLYREAPLNSIWEGSGNVICLDVLRAMVQEPGVARGLLRRDRGGRAGAEPRLAESVARAEGRAVGLRGHRGARPRDRRAHGARPPGLAAGAPRRPGRRRRVLRLPPRRRLGPRLRHAAGRRRLRARSSSATRRSPHTPERPGSLSEAQVGARFRVYRAVCRSARVESALFDATESGGLDQGLLRAHAALVRDVDGELRAAHGLPLSWYDVLCEVASAPRAAGSAWRSWPSRVMLTPAGLSGLVDRLERREPGRTAPLRRRRARDVRSRHRRGAATAPAGGTNAPRCGPPSLHEPLRSTPSWSWSGACGTESPPAAGPS